MTKKDLFDYLNEELKDIPEDATITLGYEDEIKHTYQLKPKIVCGGRQWGMIYFCVLDKGHEGDCYCSIKNVHFEPDITVRCQNCKSDQWSSKDELFIECPTCSPDHPKFHTIVEQ